MPKSTALIQMPAAGFRSSDLDPNVKQLDGYQPPRSTMNPLATKLNAAGD
jgi:hypothetical protein